MSMGQGACGVQERIRHKITLLEAGAECFIKLTNTPPERPGGNRLRLEGLAVMP